MASVPNLVETCELAERHGNRNAALLLGFAFGCISDLEVMDPPRRGMFLFEDHKIARAPFLLFLERGGWLDSAVAIERRAIEAGRQFSRLRFALGFPPD